MLRIRAATIDDVPLLHRMIVEFAAFEKLSDELSITEDMLERDGFGLAPRFHTLMAEWDGQPAGYAMYYVFYSSFQGPGLFLEDVYVRETFRAKGIGKALMAEVAAVAACEGFLVVRWEVLHWNQPAIDFYRKLGALFLDEWKAVRLEGEALQALAKSAKQGADR